MFTIFPILLQEIPDGVIDAALKANPYNAIAYGLLVVVLMLFSFLNYRDRRRMEKQHFKYMTETIGLLGRVEEKMVVLQDIRSLLINSIQKTIKDPES